MLTDKQESTPFRQWLEGARGMSPKSASDVVGRCRRAERVLGVALRELAGQGVRADVVAARLTERGEQRKRFSDMRRAALLYLEYLRGRGKGSRSDAF